MEQVYLSTAFAFALIAAKALENRRAPRKDRSRKDADGRVWTIIDREFIEE